MLFENSLKELLGKNNLTIGELITKLDLLQPSGFREITSANGVCIKVGAFANNWSKAINEQPESPIFISVNNPSHFGGTTSCYLSVDSLVKLRDYLNDVVDYLKLEGYSR